MHVRRVFATTAAFGVIAAACAIGAPLAQASGSSVHETYEAEQGAFGNGARSVKCPACSGHERVGDLGGRQDGVDTLDYVSVPTDGTYTVTVYYVSASTRNLNVTVNGVSHYFKGLTSGSWSKVAHVSFRTKLTHGDVGQRGSGLDDFDFDNPHGRAPDIDKIVISS